MTRLAAWTAATFDHVVLSFDRRCFPSLCCECVLPSHLAPLRFFGKAAAFVVWTRGDLFRCEIAQEMANSYL